MEPGLALHLYAMVYIPFRIKLNLVLIMWINLVIISLWEFIISVLTCADPGNVSHAVRYDEDAKFSYNTSVRYMCDKGYNLTSDTNVLTCLSKGNWSEGLTVCTSKFPKLTLYYFIFAELYLLW